MTEAQLERYFVKAITKIGARADKFLSPSRRGVTDRIVYMQDGPVWFVELKIEGGRLSELQKLYAKERRSMKQNYVCLWSKEEVDEWVKFIS